jgi:uncharacterized Zn finger protein
MNPPHDAEKSRCMACQQPVETAVLRPTTDHAVLLVTCPHCGVVWSAWTMPPAEPPPRY